MCFYLPPITKWKSKMAKNVTLEHEGGKDDSVTTLTGMYKEYFLDYASYVILERAVPDIDDGLIPV